MSKMPLQTLPGFLAAVEHGNLSRAAASLHLTVSALSHQMRALEERLGVKLLERGPRGVKLTVAGERLHREVAPHFEAIQHALRRPEKRNETALRINALPWFASSWLIPRLPEFVAAEPDIELSLSASWDSGGFRARRARCSAALRRRRLAPRSRRFVVRRVGAAGRDARPCSPAIGAAASADLGRWPLLGDSVGRWGQWFARNGGSATQAICGPASIAQRRWSAAPRKVSESRSYRLPWRNRCCESVDWFLSAHAAFRPASPTISSTLNERSDWNHSLDFAHGCCDLQFPHMR